MCLSEVKPGNFYMEIPVIFVLYFIPTAVFLCSNKKRVSFAKKRNILYSTNVKFDQKLQFARRKRLS